MVAAIRAHQDTRPLAASQHVAAAAHGQRFGPLIAMHERISGCRLNISAVAAEPKELPLQPSDRADTGITSQGIGSVSCGIGIEKSRSGAPAAKLTSWPLALGAIVKTWPT